MYDLSIDPNAQAGQASLDGYSVGAYATHYGDNYYWDAAIQQTWLNARASGAGDSFETNTSNLLASFEFGRSFKFANGQSLEPQVQLIAGKGHIDDASDGFTTYNYSNEDILVGRVGVRWNFADAGKAGTFAPYIKANVSRNFGDDSQLAIDIMNITTERNDTWANIGMGFSLLTKNNWTVFMQYDYERGMGQSDLENHSGSIGLRRSW